MPRFRHLAFIIILKTGPSSQCRKSTNDVLVGTNNDINNILYKLFTRTSVKKRNCLEDYMVCLKFLNICLNNNNWKNSSSIIIIKKKWCRNHQRALYLLRMDTRTFKPCMLDFVACTYKINLWICKGESRKAIILSLNHVVTALILKLYSFLSPIIGNSKTREIQYFRSLLIYY